MIEKPPDEYMFTEEELGKRMLFEERKDPDVIQISQSLIKAMHYDEVTGTPAACPRNIHACYVQKHYTAPTETMQYGLFFESAILGATRDGEVWDRLPTTPKTGKPTVDSERIALQVEKFEKEIKPAFQLDTTHAHIELKAPIQGRPDMELVGHLDLLSPILDPRGQEMMWADEDFPEGIEPELIPMAIIDIKTTKTIKSTFGDFAWGLPKIMDHTQAYMYTYLYNHNFPKLKQPPFYYVVVEFGPDMDYKVVRKNVAPHHLAELQEKIRRTIAHMDEWKRRDWPIRPGRENCARCPLKHNCDGYRVGKDIEYVN
jgi:hypothetical protein